MRGPRGLLNTSAVIAVAVVLLVSGCDGAAKGADSTLHTLSSLPVMSTPPPGGVVLGQGEDKGSDSTINGRTPEIVKIYAVADSPQTVSTYYRSTYPAAQFNVAFGASSTKVSLSGEAPDAGILVDIATTVPKVPAGFTFALKDTQLANPTYVTVKAVAIPQRK